MPVGVVARFEKQPDEIKPFSIPLHKDFLTRVDQPVSVQVFLPGISISGITLDPVLKVVSFTALTGGLDGGDYDGVAYVTTSSGAIEEFDFVLYIRATPSQINDVVTGPSALDSANAAAASAVAAANSAAQAASSASLAQAAVEAVPAAVEGALADQMEAAEIAAAASLTHSQTSAAHALEALEAAESVLLNGTAYISEGAAIQPAVDALALAGGGTVLLAPGVYETPVVLKENVTIEGAGKWATIIKLPDGADAHVIQAGDFDANATGAGNSNLGCRSAGLRNLTINGNKANQTQAKHGVAYYGIDLLLDNVEVRDCKGWGIKVEAPGVFVAQDAATRHNNQYTFRGVEAHDSELGQIDYNGQSDSNLWDINAYVSLAGPGGTGRIQFRLGSKATGCRIASLHCWGDSDYGVVSEGALSEFTMCHVESAALVKVWGKEAILWSGGRIYEVGNNKSAVAFKLDKESNSIRGVRCSNIEGGLVDTTGATTGIANSHIDISGYVANAAAQLYVGTISSSVFASLRLTGLNTASLLQTPKRETFFNGLNAPGGIDMQSGGIDGLQYLAGQGWSDVTAPGGVLTVASSHITLTAINPVNVTGLTFSVGAVDGVPWVHIRGGAGTNPITFKHNVNTLRLIGGADIVLNQYQSLSFIRVSGSVWQQIGPMALDDVRQAVALKSTLAVTGKSTLGGGADLASSALDRALYLAFQGWSAASVNAGVVNVAGGLLTLNEAAPVSVTDLVKTASNAGVMQVTFRNSGANAVTFTHNTSKLRNNSGANVVLGQHQSITYTEITPGGGVWQQTGGK